MSAEPPAEAVDPPDLVLDRVAATIRAAWDDAHGDHGRAILGYLRIGHALLTARKELRADRADGDWFRSQAFGFGTEWGRQMRLAAQHEDDAREWWRRELEAGREPSLKRCLAVLAAEAPVVEKSPPVATPVATNLYPECERRTSLEEPVAVHIRPRRSVTTSANAFEQWLRAWEDEQAPALHDVLADHLPELNADEIENIVAEILAVLRGE